MVCSRQTPHQACQCQKRQQTRLPASSHHTLANMRYTGRFSHRGAGLRVQRGFLPLRKLQPPLNVLITARLSIVGSALQPVQTFADRVFAQYRTRMAMVRLTPSAQPSRSLRPISHTTARSLRQPNTFSLASSRLPRNPARGRVAAHDNE